MLTPTALGKSAATPAVKVNNKYNFINQTRLKSKQKNRPHLCPLYTYFVLAVKQQMSMVQVQGPPTCRARMSLMVSGSECGCASTLEMTGMRGVTIFVDANAFLKNPCRVSNCKIQFLGHESLCVTQLSNCSTKNRLLLRAVLVYKH